MNGKIIGRFGGTSTKADLSAFIHMDAARSFAFLSDRIGKYYDTHPKDDEYARQGAIYRAYVVGALYTSVGFLEAAINEVFLDAEYSTRHRPVGKTIIPRGAVQGLHPKVIELMAQMWLQQQKFNSWAGRNRLQKHLYKDDPGNNIRRWWFTLDKYQLALGLNKKRPIGKTNSKWRDVFKLIVFRNYLTHAKTEWVAARALKGGSLGVQRPEKQETATLERQIRTLIMSDENRPYEGYPHEDFLIMTHFPFNRLTANFAKMAVKSSLEFYNEFTTRIRMIDLETRQPILRGTLSAISAL